MVEKKIVIKGKEITIFLQYDGNKTTITMQDNQFVLTASVRAVRQISSGYIVDYQVAGQFISVCVVRTDRLKWQVFLPDRRDGIDICMPCYEKKRMSYEGVFLQQKVLPTQLSVSDTMNNDGMCVKSPLAGRVVRVSVGLGAICTQGQLLCVIESMKMENEICAPCNAVVKNILIAPGDVVQHNQNVVVLESKGDENGATKREGEQETL